MRQIGLTLQTMFAELEQKCLDAEFDRDFPDSGSFYKQKQRGRDYWYFSWYDAKAGQKITKYVGPSDDPELAARIGRFAELKANGQERRRIVRSLVAGGLPAPDGLTGDLLRAIGSAGFFRLRGVLVGSVAYQTYSGMLGVELASRLLRTEDIDLAQGHEVSLAIGESTPPMDEILNSVDATFRASAPAAASKNSTGYRNKAGYKIEFLTPNRGSDDRIGKPAKMPALGGVFAQPLRFLDFLIREPTRSVVLHEGGVLVNVLAPERFAVHKLIV